MADQPYDPYIPSGTAGAANTQGQPGSQRTAAIQQVRFHSASVSIASGCAFRGHDGVVWVARVPMLFAPFALVAYGRNLYSSLYDAAPDGGRNGVDEQPRGSFIRHVIGISRTEKLHRSQLQRLGLRLG